MVDTHKVDGEDEQSTPIHNEALLQNLFSSPILKDGGKISISFPHSHKTNEAEADLSGEKERSSGSL